jgi:hypothetical protein
MGRPCCDCFSQMSTIRFRRRAALSCLPACVVPPTTGCPPGKPVHAGLHQEPASLAGRRTAPARRPRSQSGDQIWGHLKGGELANLCLTSLARRRRSSTRASAASATSPGWPSHSSVIVASTHEPGRAGTTPRSLGEYPRARAIRSVKSLKSGALKQHIARYPLTPRNTPPRP